MCYYFNRKLISSYILILVLFSSLGCHTVYNAPKTSEAELEREGSVVFVRPDKYTILGTRSIRDYIEITYEQIGMNESGFPKLEIGIRNRGGQHFWDTKGPEVQLSIQTAFYNEPIQPGGPASKPSVYKTNWQTVKLVRGETSDYKVTCPVKGAMYYQVTISEFLK